MICDDNLPLSQPKPVERVLFLDKAAICKLLDENDKRVLIKSYNLKITEYNHFNFSNNQFLLLLNYVLINIFICLMISAIIWSSKENEIYVTLHDVDAILRDGDTTNNVSGHTSFND